MTVVGVGLWISTHAVRCANVMDGAPGTWCAAECVKSNRRSFDSLRSLKMTVVGVGLWFPALSFAGAKHEGGATGA